MISREGNLPKSLREFALFMQGIESNNPTVVERIRNATSIVVTKVRNTSQSTEETQTKEKINNLEGEIRILKDGVDKKREKI
jgi:hypothetical protein